MTAMLSRNFSLDEFLRSRTASDRHIANPINEEQLGNISRLVTRLLQPLRDAANEALIVNSGLRSEELNRAVGGKETSQHLKGEAADIRPESGEVENLLSVLLSGDLDFDQAILYPTFLHLSYRDGKNRKQVIYNAQTKKS